MTRRALEILKSQRNDAYEAALAELRDDTQGWWMDALRLAPDELEEDEEPATADVAGLRRFLDDKVLPWFEERKEEIGRRPLLRDQAFGKLLDPDKLERLGRYEVHLDRKLERMLSMLFRLKECAGFQTPLIRFAKFPIGEAFWSPTSAAWTLSPASATFDLCIQTTSVSFL